MTYEYGLADGRHSLAGGRGGELDGQVGQTEDVHQRLQTLLADELATVVVRRVVAQDRLHELHLHVNNKGEGVCLLRRRTFCMCMYNFFTDMYNSKIHFDSLVF